MGQLTLYLDTETEKKMKAAAKAAGLSLSRWVAGLIRERTVDKWPESVVQLAGAWPDMPSLEEIRAEQGEDVPRQPL